MTKKQSLDQALAPVVDRKGDGVHRHWASVAGTTSRGTEGAAAMVGPEWHIEAILTWASADEKTTKINPLESIQPRC